MRGLYVISDDRLTPSHSIEDKIKQALDGGAKMVQLRDKSSSDEEIVDICQRLSNLCRRYDAKFILNDKVELAIELGVDGLHIGKSDHYRVDEIRKDFDGILGVSCYSDIEYAKELEKKGVDYVAFGSFFSSLTKPDSQIIALEILSKAKESLNIPVCAIGGIKSSNVDRVIKHNPDMIATISDVWLSDNIEQKSRFYSDLYKESV